jgi:hypothetical protein
MISSKIVHLIICNSKPHYFKHLEIQNFHSSGVNGEEMSYLNGIRRQMALEGKWHMLQHHDKFSSEPLGS